MRDPDRAQAEHVDEAVVGQRCAEIGKNGRLPAGRLRDRAGGEADPGIVGIEPARLEETGAAEAHLDLGKAVAVEMAAQRRNDVVGLGSDHIAQLAVRARIAGNGVDRPFRRAGGECQHLEAVPAEHALGRREVRLAPIRVDARAVAAAFDLETFEAAPHRLRQRRPPLRHPDRSARVGDAGERVRQDDAGIGEEAAPVAGMMPALAQLDDQVDGVAAARAEKDRRLAGRNARAVRGDQHIRLQKPILVLHAKLVQPDGADFLAHLDQDLDVEAQARAGAFALGKHRRERRDIDAVLSLVVGGAAAVDAVAFHRQHPRRKSRPPQIVEAADGVAVAIDQNGEQGGILDAFRDQERRTRRIVEHARGETEQSEARCHLIVEITAQGAGAFRLLAGARNGDAAPQIDEELAVVEIGMRAGDRGSAAHEICPFRRYARLKSLRVAVYGPGILHRGHCRRKDG